MGEVKAKLKVVLTANDTVVAEADDPVLWQKVLTAINSQSGAVGDLKHAAPLGDGGFKDEDDGEADDESAGGRASSPELGKLAGALKLSPAVVEGACAPSKQDPFLHLDAHCWEEMKRQLPSRGPNAIGPGVVVASLLGCWFRSAGLGNTTLAQVHTVLGNLGTRDQNAHRSIGRCEWLQQRPGGVIQLNPAEISKAFEVARKFCSKKWLTGKSE